MALVRDEITLQSSNILKVLIADDDTPTRMLLRAAISQWGYEVIEAGDGEEAWEQLNTPNAPGLLIVDWLMPRLDGIGLCERIKRELKQSPYIILLTQLGGTSNIVKGLEAGADEFLSKPFNMAELRSRLSVGARIVKYERRCHQQDKLLNELSIALFNAGQNTSKIIDAAANSGLVNDGKFIEKIRSLEEQLSYMSNLVQRVIDKKIG